MNDRVFTGKSVTEALRKVREAMGPDAVILSQQRSNGVVQVLASVDFPVPDNPRTTSNTGGPSAAA